MALILVNLGSPMLANVTLSGGPNHTMNHYAWFAKWLKIVASSWMHHPTVHVVSRPSKCGWSFLHCDINTFAPNHMAVAWDVGCLLSFPGGRSCQFLSFRSRATVSDIIVGMRVLSSTASCKLGSCVHGVYARGEGGKGYALALACQLACQPTKHLFQVPFKPCLERFFFCGPPHFCCLRVGATQ